mgnify:CR=1 FL=1
MWNQLKYILTSKEKGQLVVLMFMVVFGSFLELLGVSIFMPFINTVMDMNSIFETPYLLYFYNLLCFNSTTDFVVAITGCIIFIYIFKNIYLAIEKNMIYKFSYNIQTRTSTGLLKAYMEQPYTFFLKKNTAELQRSMQEDCDLFTKGIIHILELIAELVVCLVMGIYLFFVSKSITLIVIGLMAVCTCSFVLAIKNYAKTLGKNNQVYKGKLYQWMNQALGGVKEIKVLNREQYFIKNYDAYFAKYVVGLRISRLLGILPKYIVETVCMVGLMIAIIVKIMFGQKDMIDFLPQLSVFAVAAFRLMPSVGRINEHYSATLYSLPSVELIYNDLKAVEDIVVKKKAMVENWKLKEAVTIKEVSYHYPDASENVLENISFDVKKGTTVAIIGSSGSGKTTLIDILLGLLKPQYGRMYADDLNIDKNLVTWQKEIGYIPQMIYLSDDTIRNNIAFGIDESEIDDVAVETALKQAQLYEFVQNLPDGIDTFVGDRGVRLSGGQRQRIGIARALYHNPEILVLDEATSALDSETETAVMESINSLHGIKTLIIIAHRLTTIQNADVIYEVLDGKVEKKDKGEIF